MTNLTNETKPYLDQELVQLSRDLEEGTRSFSDRSTAARLLFNLIRGREIIEELVDYVDNPELEIVDIAEEFLWGGEE